MLEVPAPLWVPPRGRGEAGGKQMDLCWGWDTRINGLSCSSLAVQSRVVVLWEPGIMAECAQTKQPRSVTGAFPCQRAVAEL